MVYEIALKGVVENNLMVNVHHVTATTSLCADIAESWFTTCLTPYLACLSGGYTLNEIVVTDVVQKLQSAMHVGSEGVQGGSMLPPQDAAIITWRTGFIGRKYRGRTYMPAIPELSQSGGVLDNASQLRYAAYAGALMSAFEADATGRLVLYHKATKTVIAPPAPTTITSFVVRSVVYTQRRRTLGVGA